MSEDDFYFVHISGLKDQDTYHLLPFVERVWWTYSLRGDPPDLVRSHRRVESFRHLLGRSRLHFVSIGRANSLKGCSNAQDHRRIRFFRRFTELEPLPWGCGVHNTRYLVDGPTLHVDFHFSFRVRTYHYDSSLTDAFRDDLISSSALKYCGNPGDPCLMQASAADDYTADLMRHMRDGKKFEFDRVTFVRAVGEADVEEAVEAFLRRAKLEPTLAPVEV